MDYCWQGRIWVFIGALLVAIGTLIATYGWNDWTLRTERKRLFRKGMWDIIRGTAIVMIGGLLATHGWNVISFGEQRRSLIRALSQEILLSCAELETFVESPSAYRAELVETKKFKILPVIKTNALNGVLASGLWNWENEEDEEFLIACLNCLGRAEKANRVLDSITAKLVTASTKEEIATARVLSERIESSEYQDQLKHLFDEVTNLLNKKYEWALDELLLGLRSNK